MARGPNQEHIAQEPLSEATYNGSVLEREPMGNRKDKGTQNFGNKESKYQISSWECFRSIWPK